MPSYITGNSNYPNDYDLYPVNTGTYTPTIEYVLDELRDPVTGVISQSGNVIIAESINSVYTIIQHLQQTLGLNVEDVFPTVNDRLNYLQYSGSGAFVPKVGGDMTGDLVMQPGAAINTYDIISNGLTVESSGSLSLIAASGMGISSTGLMNISVASGLDINGATSAINVYANDFTVSSAVSSIGASNGLFLSGNDITLNSTGNVTTNASIIPGLDLTYDLGSSGLRFANIYADTISTSGGTFDLSSLYSSFIAKSGDTVLGDLYLNTGISILPAISGDGFLGSAAFPLSGVYTKQLNASFITGLSPVTFLSDVIIPGPYSILMDSGASIQFSGSGTSNIGEPGFPVGTLYADNVVSAGLLITGLVHTSGDTMTGSLVFDSGNNVVLNSGSVYPATSGVGTVGTSGNYFDNVYTNNINNRAISNLVFNEVAQPTANPMIFTLVNSPVVGSAMIFVSGILIAPATQYQIISGNYIVMTGSMFTPGSGSVTAGFYIY